MKKINLWSVNLLTVAALAIVNFAVAEQRESGPEACMQEFFDSQTKRPSTKAIKRAEKKCGMSDDRADSRRPEPKKDTRSPEPKKDTRRPEPKMDTRRAETDGDKCNAVFDYMGEKGLDPMVIAVLQKGGTKKLAEAGFDKGHIKDLRKQAKKSGKSLRKVAKKSGVRLAECAPPMDMMPPMPTTDSANMPATAGGAEMPQDRCGPVFDYMGEKGLDPMILAIMQKGGAKDLAKAGFDKGLIRDLKKQAKKSGKSLKKVAKKARVKLAECAPPTDMMPPMPAAGAVNMPDGPCGESMMMMAEANIDPANLEKMLTSVEKRAEKDAMKKVAKAFKMKKSQVNSLRSNIGAWEESSGIDLEMCLEGTGMPQCETPMNMLAEAKVDPNKLLAIVGEIEAGAMKKISKKLKMNPEQVGQLIEGLETCGDA